MHGLHIDITIKQMGRVNLRLRALYHDNMMNVRIIVIANN